MRAREDPAADVHSTSTSKAKQKKEDDKRNKEKVQVREKSELPRTKSRSRKTAKDDLSLVSDPELLEAQTEYFRVVERVRKESK